jgi:tryptophan synthase beta chain
MDENDQPSVSYSIAAGLDYPGISPQHAQLLSSGRAKYYPVLDNDAIDAYITLSRLEGIIPAIESSHAVALAMELLKDRNRLAVINLSGRGDKDVERKLENYFKL